MTFSAMCHEASAEEIVIRLLTSRRQLSVKNAYAFFLQRAPKGMTLQGFYKIIQKLIARRVLVKEGGLLSLDASWVQSMVDFSHRLEQTFFGQDSSFANVLLEEDEHKEFIFSSVLDMDNFWTHALVLMTRYYAKHPHPDKNGYAFTEHAWFQLLRTSQEHYLNNLYREHNMSITHVVGSTSFLDRTAVDLAKAENYHAILVPKSAFTENTYIMTVGDYIFETHLPKYIHAEFSRLYDSTDSLATFNAEYFQKLLREPAKTRLTISRDAKRAREFRKKITGLQSK